MAQTQQKLSKQPPFLLYLLAFTMPWMAGGNFPLVLSSASAHLLWIALLLVTWGLANATRAENLRTLFFDKARLPFVLFPLYLLIHVAFFTKELHVTVSSTLLWVEAMMMGGLLVLYRLDDRRLLHFALALALGAMVSALYGVYQVFWGFDQLRDFARQADLIPSLAGLVEQTRQAFSTFPGVNMFGGYLLPYFVLALGGVLFLKKISFRVFSLVFLLAVVAGLWSSYSRGAIGLAFLLVPWIVFLRLKPGVRRFALAAYGLLVVVAIGVVVVCLLSGNPSSCPVVGGILEKLSRDSAWLGRIGYWRAALTMGWEYFPFGAGFGTYGSLSYPFQANVQYSGHSHNLLLSFWAELGLVGVVLLLSMLVSVVLRALKQGDRGYLLLTALAAMLLHAMVDIDFHSPAIVCGFFLITAVVMLPDLPDLPKTPLARHHVVQVLVSVGMILAIFSLRVLTWLAGDQFTLATLALERQNGEQALSLCESSLNVWPYNTEAWRMAADLRLSAGDSKGALLAAGKAVDLSPRLPHVYLTRAHTRQKTGDIKGAGEDYTRAAVLAPMRLSIRVARASWEVEYGEVDKALEIVNQSLPLAWKIVDQKDPNAFDVFELLFLKGSIMIYKNQWDQAIEVYDRIIELSQKPLVLKNYISDRQTGMTLEELGQRAESFKKRAIGDRNQAVMEALKKQQQLQGGNAE